MKTIVADPWERTGWNTLAVIAILIIIVFSWVASEKAINSIGAFVKP
jgi:hypothetical protein